AAADLSAALKSTDERFKLLQDALTAQGLQSREVTQKAIERAHKELGGLLSGLADILGAEG
ncbi:MAG: hypothetical protein ACYCYF_12000, partial [Anaerolineae bacterium]